jgi:hypothetical protein
MEKPTVKQLTPKYKIGESEYDSSLTEDLFVNRNDLSNEFANHAERYAWYATCYELAQADVEYYHAQLDRAYAVIDIEKRTELTNSNQKVTEKMVENMVLTDDRYTQIQDMYLDACKNAGVLKAAMFSMQHKKDMLVQLGSSARAEMNSDISLKATYAKHQLDR